MRKLLFVLAALACQGPAHMPEAGSPPEGPKKIDPPPMDDQAQPPGDPSEQPIAAAAETETSASTGIILCDATPVSQDRSPVQGEGVKLYGNISYSGQEQGPVLLELFDKRNKTVYHFYCPSTGDFVATAPERLGNVTVAAFLDAEKDGPTAGDPAGLSEEIEIKKGLVRGIDITIVAGAGFEYKPWELPQDFGDPSPSEPPEGSPLPDDAPDKEVELPPENDAPPE